MESSQPLTPVVWLDWKKAMIYKKKGCTFWCFYAISVVFTIVLLAMDWNQKPQNANNDQSVMNCNLNSAKGDSWQVYLILNVFIIPLWFLYATCFNCCCAVKTNRIHNSCNRCGIICITLPKNWILSIFPFNIWGFWIYFDRIVFNDTCHISTVLKCSFVVLVAIETMIAALVSTQQYRHMRTVLNEHSTVPLAMADANDNHTVTDLETGNIGNGWWCPDTSAQWEFEGTMVEISASVQRRYPNLRLDENCVICTDGFNTFEVVVLLPCKHPFHRDCIGTWLNQSNHSCPLCRKTIQRRSKAN